jgi:hypothetical protein
MVCRQYGTFDPLGLRHAEAARSKRPPAEPGPNPLIPHAPSTMRPGGQKGNVCEPESEGESLYPVDGDRSRRLWVGMQSGTQFALQSYPLPLLSKPEGAAATKRVPYTGVRCSLR